MSQTPLVLLVLDGWGIREARENNAIKLARTPVFDALLARYPNAQLQASGEAVGLPAGQMGNSEVGHMNMGAGRVVYQDLTRIDKSIRDGDFFANPALLAAMDRVRDGRHALHLVGLVSDGGVHSHQRHLHALLEMAARRGVARVFVQAITDGRDTSPTGGVRYLADLEQAIANIGAGTAVRVASVSGRYYAMDRDKRWERTKAGYDAMRDGIGDSTARSPLDAVRRSYAAGVTDEFIKPVVIVDADGAAVGPIRDGDSMIVFNFRADRVRQITRALALDDFDGFERPNRPRVDTTTMTVYDRTFNLPVVFTPQTFTNNLADVLADHARTNLRLAETEKYAHVTYFFNCGREEPYPGEDRILVPSPKVATYDLKPEMSALEVTDRLVEAIGSGRYDAIVCNYANGDMVGHTGNFEAATRAIETLDACLGRVVDAARAVGGEVLITADHGNAEQLHDDATGQAHTAHTLNLVPCVYVGRPATLSAGGALQDIAPTLLALMGLPKPAEMTGHALVRFDDASKERKAH